MSGGREACFSLKIYLTRMKEFYWSPRPEDFDNFLLWIGYPAEDYISMNKSEHGTEWMVGRYVT